MPRSGITMQPIHAYIAFAFAIPWAIWILMDLLGLYGSKAYMAATAILMFMPMLSALIVHRIFRIPAIRVSWKPKIRKNSREYLAAWLFPPTLSAAGSVLYFALFPEDFSIASFQMAAESLGLTDAAFFSMMLAAMLSGAFINMLFALGEEAGWRGFLCPMLSERTGEAKAYIITGVIWGLWHTPVNIMGYNYGLGYIGYPILGIAAMCLFCTSIGTWLSFLARKSQSIWPPALFHGSVNASASIGLLFLPEGSASYLLGPALSGIIPSMLAGIAILIIIGRDNNHN